MKIKIQNKGILLFLWSLTLILMLFALIGMLIRQIDSLDSYIFMGCAFLIAVKIELSLIFSHISINMTEKAIYFHYIFFTECIYFNQIKKWGIRSFRIKSYSNNFYLELITKENQQIRYPICFAGLTNNIIQEQTKLFSKYLPLKSTGMKEIDGRGTIGREFWAYLLK